MNQSTNQKQAQINNLKQQGFAYLPKNMETIAAQKQILAMLADAVVPVRVSQEKANREIWPKVENGAMPITQAVTQCAYDADKLIGMTIIENLKLQEKDRETQLKAWIVLDYYCYVLKAEYSVHIRKLQDHLTSLLQSDNKGDFLKDLPPIRSDFTPPAPPAAKPVPAPKPKKKGKAGLIVTVAAIAVVIALVCMHVLSPVTKTEKAIDAIGEVTMESESLIEAAEALYYELTSEQQQKVENAQMLLEARASFDNWESAIEKAVDAIDAIGTVTLESGDTIKAARSAYDNLKVYDLTDYASHKLSTLERAEKAYENLYVQTLCDSALELQTQKKYQEALDAYNAILTEYPNSNSAATAKEGAMDCTAQLAQAEIRANNLESAMEMLTQVNSLCGYTETYTKAYEALQQRLKQIRPANGKTFTNKIDWGWGEFTVSASSDSDAYIKLESLTDPNKYMTFYVQAGQDATVKIKDGTYIVKYTTGENWFGPDAMFGKNAAFTKADDTFTFTTTTSGSYVYYSTISITLYTVAGGDLTTTPITADSF